MIKILRKYIVINNIFSFFSYNLLGEEYDSNRS